MNTKLSAMWPAAVLATFAACSLPVDPTEREVTISEGLTASPSVVYRADTSTYRVAAVAGAKPENLTQELDALSAGTDDWAAVAPAGGWLTLGTHRFGCPAGLSCLALVSGDLSSTELVKVSGSSPVTTNGRGIANASGTAIVYEASGAHTRDIFVVTRASRGWSAPVSLTASSPYSFNETPSLSSDGSQVLFDCGNAPYAATGTGVCQVGVNGAGFRSVVRPTASGQTAFHHATFAPDGSIVFEGDGAATLVYRLASGSTSPQAIGAFNNDHSPCVLPSGDVASLWVGRPGNTTSTHELKLMPSSGATYTMLVTGANIVDVGITCGAGAVPAGDAGAADASDGGAAKDGAADATPDHGGVVSNDGAADGAADASGATGSPATDHPRLWIRSADVARLRGWAQASNPLYASVLSPIGTTAKATMDANRTPFNTAACDDGWMQCESYAELFAFLSLVDPSATNRADYAQRARTAILKVVNAYNANQLPTSFSTGDRSRWSGEALALAVDWIYATLSATDKAAIHTAFLSLAALDQVAATTTDNHPVPVGVTNNASLLSDPVRVRFSDDNYYAAHMRNLGLMALSFDPADDPGGALGAYLSTATGAWLYVLDAAQRGDARGGMPAEGLEYGPQTFSYAAELLLALRTAGQNNPNAWGPQVKIENQPWYADAIASEVHLASPAQSAYPAGSGWDFATQPWFYGDSQNYWLDDHIDLFGAMGIDAMISGDAARVAAARWIQLNFPPRHADSFDPTRPSTLAVRIGQTDRFRTAILYFMLFDPAASAPADPRPALPLAHVADGVGRILARTSWQTNANMFAYGLGWATVDHQHADGNDFGFYRHGEWLTKERAGYNGNLADDLASDCHNTLAIMNDGPPAHNDGYRQNLWQRGSQWTYGLASGDGKIVAKSIGTSFVYATGDATALYNSTSEGVSGVAHASRSIVWLEPDVIVVYDRARTVSTPRAKTFYLQVPATPKIDATGRVATVTTPAGQQLFVTELLPVPGTFQTSAAGQAPDVSPSIAGYEPMKVRLTSSSSDQDARFLHVLEGADAGAARHAPQAVTSVDGSYAGTAVAGQVVLFPVSLGGAVTSLAYTAPSGTTAHLITGLTPSASYDVSKVAVAGGLSVTVKPGTQQAADSGGVLSF